MKNKLLIFALVLISLTAWSQENAFTLGGGYSFANIEDADENGTGFRINGLYEYIPGAGKIAHGLSVGYIGINADVKNVQTTNYKINTWPIYYAPKFMFGKKDNFKGFVKGALGMQFSGFKRTGYLGEVDTNDAGFYGGASAGAMISPKDNFFINVEYEWAYLSNSYYVDGFMNSVMVGFGFRF
jgi:hypothetical protein